MLQAFTGLSDATCKRARTSHQVYCEILSRRQLPQPDSHVALTAATAPTRFFGQHLSNIPNSSAMRDCDSLQAQTRAPHPAGPATGAVRPEVATAMIASSCAAGSSSPPLADTLELEESPSDNRPSTPDNAPTPGTHQLMPTAMLGAASINRCAAFATQFTQLP